MNNLTGKNHPNRVICPKCGKTGTKKSRMIKRGNFNSGPYFYVAHRVGKKMKECYIGKNWPSGAHKNSVGGRCLKKAYVIFQVPEEIKTEKEAEKYIWDKMVAAVEKGSIELLPDFDIHQIE